MYPDDMTQAFIATLQDLTRNGGIEWQIVERLHPVLKPPGQSVVRFQSTHKGLRIELFRENSPPHVRNGDDRFHYVLAIHDAQDREVWRAERSSHAIESLYRHVRQRLIKIDDLLSNVVDPATLAYYASARESRVQDLIDGDGLRGWLRRQRRALHARFFAPRHA